MDAGRDHEGDRRRRCPSESLDMAVLSRGSRPSSSRHHSKVLRLQRKEPAMHLHLVRAVPYPVPMTEVTQRPAKIVTLEARRQARLQAATARPPLDAA